MNIREKFNNVMATLSILGIAGLFLNNLFNPKTSPVEVNTRIINSYPAKVIKKQYDFLTPKEGVCQDSSSKKIQKIYHQISKNDNQKFPNGYFIRPIGKQPYGMVAPSTKKQFYFVNAYLNGYVPYKSDSVWGPLDFLRTRLHYQFDEIQYKGRLEVWQTSKESFEHFRGDCEDHAIVLADWLIGLGYDARVALGKVKFKGQKIGGHAWVVLFENGKEYILEATNKAKWNQLPLASSLPYYYPKYMFNRQDFWLNTGSVYTVKYLDKKWKKNGIFVPDDPYYPDLHTHALYIETSPQDVNIRILNIEQKFYQGMQLRTGRYHVQINKEGYATEEIWVDIHSKNLYLKKDLSILM